jgi:hypothetical protein
MNTHDVPIWKSMVGIERGKGREEGGRRERVKRGSGIKRRVERSRRIIGEALAKIKPADPSR